MKKSKIVCTIGPASENRKVINKMYSNGMNACRINLSYGDFKEYDKMIKNIRKECNLPIILDTQGREVRIRIKEEKNVKKGEEIELRLSINVYKKLKKNVKVLFNDGFNQGVIKKVNKDSIIVKMEDNASLEPNSSVVFKKVKFKLPLLTSKDKKGIKYAIKNQISFVAVSYTQNASDVKKVKKLLKNSGIKVISKIEDRKGVDNFKEIIEETDAVIIGRGDMGVEIPSEEIPLLQKEVILECNKKGKPVIVATQMMESMINNKNPTRAETSDVANAVLDGADCIMLSGETSIGKHPSLVVKKVKSICLNVEKSNHIKSFQTNMSNIVNTITNNAYQMAECMKGKIICFTRSGYTARMISRFKPEKVITALTRNEMVKKQLMINYAVNPILHKDYEHYDIKKITSKCLKKRLIKKTDLIVFVAGLYIKNTTNTITLYKVSELMK